MWGGRACAKAVDSSLTTEGVGGYALRHRQGFGRENGRHVVMLVITT